MNTLNWPFNNSEEAETNVAIAQRMVGRLVATKSEHQALDEAVRRELAAVGIECAQIREEEACLTLAEAAQATGLDQAFIPILESGKALPSELTDEWLAAISQYGADTTYIAELRRNVTLKSEGWIGPIKMPKDWCGTHRIYIKPPK